MAVTKYTIEHEVTESDSLEMTVTTVNETISVMEGKKITEPSEFASAQENSNRLERNTGSLEIIDDSIKDRTTVAAIEDEFNFTSTSWNIASSMNVSAIRTSMDYHDIKDVTVPSQEEIALQQPSTTSTVRQSTGTRGEAESSAIYEKTDGL